ncbi:TPA: hypothetical protein ACH3X3_007969 [Trebouxia sp. C0006]
MDTVMVDVSTLRRGVGLHQQQHSNNKSSAGALNHNQALPLDLCIEQQTSSTFCGNWGRPRRGQDTLAADVAEAGRSSMVCTVYEWDKQHQRTQSSNDGIGFTKDAIQ